MTPMPRFLPLLLAAATCAPAAFAGELAVDNPAPSLSLIPGHSFARLAPLAPTGRHPFASQPLSDAALAAKRGGDAGFSATHLGGSVSGNQASNVVTGSNTVSDGAFAGASGVATVIQNSGNNVLIQNATVVNLQLK